MAYEPWKQSVDPGVLAAFQAADKAGRKSLLDDYGPDWKGGLYKALGIPAGMTGWDAANWTVSGGSGGAAGGAVSSAPAPDLSLGSAVKKSEGDYNTTKTAINDAFQAGVMKPDEYNRLTTKAFQDTRAQYANVRRNVVERGYNRVNTGAMGGELRNVNMGEIGALGANRFRINQARDTQNANASRWKAGALADLMTRRQIPWQQGASVNLNTPAVPAQPRFQYTPPPPRTPDYSNAWGEPHRWRRGGPGRFGYN